MLLLITTTQLLHVTYGATTALNNKKNHHIVSFDFSKAFDKVPHNLLIHKLRQYKFSGEVLLWIAAWLRNRTSKVVVNGNYSMSFGNSSGVPQGSVLGPLLFLLYVNDLPGGVLSDCRLYADDTLLCCDVEHPNDDRLQRDVSALESWSKKWQMPFNNRKCLHMQVGRQTPDFNLFLNNESISTTTEIKYLGITLSEDMKWNVHVANTVKQANKTLGMIRRCLQEANIKTKLLAFNTVVRPILEYATQVWSPGEIGLSRSIEMIQRKAVKWVYRMNRRESIELKMEAENVHTLAERRAQHDLLFLRKVEFGDYDIQLENYIKTNESYDTRKGVIATFKRINAYKNHFYNRMESEVKVLFPHLNLRFFIF